jgi:hypothetical protein
MHPVELTMVACASGERSAAMSSDSGATENHCPAKKLNRLAAIAAQIQRKCE